CRWPTTLAGRQTGRATAFTPGRLMILVDTSICGRLADKDDPLHLHAKAGMQYALRQATPPFIAAQTLYEFWVVATRPKSNNGLGWEPVRTAAWLRKLRQTCQFLEDDRRTFSEWEQLVTTSGTRGKPAHDARLVAVMKLNGIASVMTFN